MMQKETMDSNIHKRFNRRKKKQVHDWKMFLIFIRRNLGICEYVGIRYLHIF